MRKFILLPTVQFRRAAKVLGATMQPHISLISTVSSLVVKGIRLRVKRVITKLLI